MNAHLDLIIQSFFIAIWIMIPAYIPNPSAALFGGGLPVDFGRCAGDGKRILGDGKTYRGLIFGIAAGILLGGVQIIMQDSLGWPPLLTLPAVILLATGALLGDMGKSFIKRRIGKDRGDEWLIADQYDLVAGAFLMLILFDLPWLLSTVSLIVGLWILILTPVLHRGVNIIGYMAGVKDVPW